MRDAIHSACNYSLTILPLISTVQYTATRCGRPNSLNPLSLTALVRSGPYPNHPFRPVWINPSYSVSAIRAASVALPYLLVLR